jgi:hypothetical protein
MKTFPVQVDLLALRRDVEEMVQDKRFSFLKPLAFETLKVAEEGNERDKRWAIKSLLQIIPYYKPTVRFQKETPSERQARIQRELGEALDRLTSAKGATSQRQENKAPLGPVSE